MLLSATSGRHRRVRILPRSRHALAAAVLTGLVLSLASVGTTQTLASFTDTAPVGGNTVTTSSVQPPTNLTVTRPAAQPVAAPVLTWTATPSAFATGYAIYASTATGGPYTQIGTVQGRGTTTFTDPEPSRIRSTYYVVTALAYNWYSGKTSESAGSAQTYSSAVLNDGPIGYWRLNETSGVFTDSSGHSMSAAVTGTIGRGKASLVATDSTNKSVTIADGSNAYAQVADNATLHTITQATGLTYEMWIKTPASFGSPGQSRTLISKGSHDMTAYADFDLAAYSDDGVHLSRFYTESTFFGNAGGTGRALSLEPNTVHHLVVTTAANGYAAFYLDGRLIDSNAGEAHTVTPLTNAPLWLGNGDSDNWNGGLDEVALYNKTLTDTQIRAHYRAGLTTTQSVSDSQSYATSVSQDHPTSYWPLNDAQGSPTISNLGWLGGQTTTYNQGGITLGQPSLLSTTPAKSATFDDTGNTYAEADFDPAYNSQTLAIELWLKTPADLNGPTDGSDAYLGLVSKYGYNADGDGQRDYNLYAYTNNGHTVTGFHFSSGVFQTSFAHLDTPLAPNTVHQVVVTIDEYRNTYYFLDGAYIPNVEVSAGADWNATMTDGTVAVGRAEDNWWYGGLGQVSIYDHPLESDRVAQHYNAARQVPQDVEAGALWTLGSVRWNPPPTDDAVSGYKIYRGTDQTHQTELATVSGATRQYTDNLDDTGINGEYLYWYSVAAIAPDGSVGARSAAVLAWLADYVPDNSADTGDVSPNHMGGRILSASLGSGELHLTGWAADTDNLSGALGIQMWAFPAGGGPVTYLGTRATGHYNAAVDAQYGSALSTDGFDVYVPSPGPGSWTVVVQAIGTYPTIGNERLYMDIDVTL